MTTVSDSKLLAQAHPAAATLTIFYTVPAGIRTHARTLFICNAAGAVTTFRLSVAPGNAPRQMRQSITFIGKRKRLLQPFRHRRNMNSLVFALISVEGIAGENQAKLIHKLFTDVVASCCAAKHRRKPHE